MHAFKADLCISDIHSIPESNRISDAIRTYDTKLYNLIENHASEYQCTFKLQHNAPWHNTTLNDTKWLCRNIVHHWKKTRSETDHKSYRFQCQAISDELVKDKSECYQSTLSEVDSQTDVYSIANSLLVGRTG